MGLFDVCCCDGRGAHATEATYVAQAVGQRWDSPSAQEHAEWQVAHHEDEDAAKEHAEWQVAHHEDEEHAEWQVAHHEDEDAAKAVEGVECHRHDEPCDDRREEQPAQAEPVPMCEFIDDEGYPVKVDFATRFAGMSLGRKEGSKVIVRAVRQGGQAERLGVKTGWTLKAIQGTEVTDLAHGVSLLKECFDELPEAETAAERAPAARPTSRALLFEGANGATHEVEFASREPGFTVDLRGGSCCVAVCKSGKPQVAVKTVQAGGQAEANGVRVGWALRRVGGVEVTDRAQAARILQQFFDQLPAQ